MANRHTCYNDEALCNDLAQSDLSMAQIAASHKVSASLLYSIARGDTRPELKVRVDEILAANKSAAMRLAKVRARWAIARLVQLGTQNEDKKAALAAVEKILEMSGMLTGDAVADKQTIELVFSNMNDAKPEVKNRLSGVYNSNGHSN